MLALSLPNMVFIMLRYIPSTPNTQEVLSGKDVILSNVISICWDNQAILSFLLLMQCITSIYLDVEPSLHPMDKFHLVMVYNSFSVLLNLVSWYLDENFYIYIYPGYWHIVSFTYNVLVYLISRCNTGLVEWV